MPSPSQPSARATSNVRSSTPRPDERLRARRADCTRSSASWRASRRHSSTGMATPTKPMRSRDEAAAASVAAGDQITEIWARLVIATVAMRSGRFDAARASIDQAQATSHAIQGVWWGGAIFRSQALLASYEATAAGERRRLGGVAGALAPRHPASGSSWRPARARPHLEAGGRGGRARRPPHDRTRAARCGARRRPR